MGTQEGLILIGYPLAWEPVDRAWCRTRGAKFAMSQIAKTIASLRQAIVNLVRQDRHQDIQKLLLGELILRSSWQDRQQISSLAEVEFKVFSQWGDDGIIQYLVRQLDFPESTFIEFGVADYWESNTRFLLMHNNWSGYVIDSSARNIKQLQQAYFFWQYDLQAQSAFCDRGNINDLLRASGFAADVGILHIDIDGNDYWVWQAIEVVKPIVAIVEYNSVFGIDRAITIPYDRQFDRTTAHPSNLYFGASLAALYHLGQTKGYTFIGCNSAGNNAYFVRQDKLGHLQAVSLEQGYVMSKFRESRDRNGQLNYLRAQQRLEAIAGLPVVNVKTGETEQL
jgi:hypothetical protein